MRQNIQFVKKQKLTSTSSRNNQCGQIIYTIYFPTPTFKKKKKKILIQELKMFNVLILKFMISQLILISNKLNVPRNYVVLNFNIQYKEV